MLRMAVVGLGMGGSYGAMLHKAEGVEFAAMCDTSQERLDWRAGTYKEEIGAEPAAYLSVAEMLAAEADLDGVIISTPSGTHHQVAVAVAEAGVNLLIDKPIDISAENIDRIDRAVSASGVLCGVNYQMRCAALNRGIKRALDTGALGRPLICDMRMKWYRTQEYYDEVAWRGTWAMGGGSLMNQGAHSMDLLCWLMGRPRTVVGEFAAINHDIEAEDWASGIIEFDSGARSTVSTTTCVTPETDTTWLEVHGTAGSVFVKGDELLSSTVENLDTLDPSPFDHPVADFIDAVANSRAPMVSIEQARWSVDVINGLYQAAREARRVEL